ncbi:LLM class flavin-dependent oxidoreductase [Microbacterium sp. ANT_H45B]|uniref:LLM class flavin-dependent oxidoreductase n=1 Tax=Microbacterium sp. ANT_H45B TaxID=2597346 RepID=UPI0011F034BF|nr:LLM class flavin-dependent oxidoreductase [Microbacterium sp. ANT_H45B]KAA0962534.1 LLM class flavin-dependent oxidoreductase [Microbacterium sp. ANT_H45B]
MSDTERDDKMILGALLSPTSAHIAGWRHDGALTNVDVTFPELVKVVKSAEQAKLDFVFIADELSMPAGEAETLSRDPLVYRFEPLTLVAALAVASKNIGLVVTQSTTYNEPYHIARKLASIDQLSGGRLGWNLVTSYVPEEAKNFSRSEHLASVDRYERAEEFLQVAQGLWDSWDDDAFDGGDETGRYFDPRKMHRLDHEGTHFSVRGPLNVRRPVQGAPVQVQAGSSEAGRELAAKYAEITFTAQNSLDAALAFTNDIKTRAARHGRSASSVRVIAGVQPIIGATMEEAQAKYREMQSLIHPEVGLTRLSQLLDYDVTQLPLDAPLPDDLPETENYKSRRALIIETGRRENLTLRELYQKVVSSYGHRVVIGTPQSVADELADWFIAGAVDGYILSPAYLPDGLHDFIRTVVPELRSRGLLRAEYEGATFRENLGLARPERGAYATS